MMGLVGQAYSLYQCWKYYRVSEYATANNASYFKPQVAEKQKSGIT